ncbi:MAG: hypothetical protein IT158_25495 [Bryobacterales bacterium]|nr:hypothetical protein [Bryobacterales bacterium]
MSARVASLWQQDCQGRGIPFIAHRPRTGSDRIRGLLKVSCAIVVLGIPAARAQAPVRGRAANPHGRLTVPCENCHSTDTWRPLRAVPEFDHNSQTRFPLRGLHQRVACASCHVSLVFSNTGSRCADCHADVHRRQFGAGCESCHTVMGWRVAISAVQKHQNRFPLVGAHAAVACESCHRGAASSVFTGLSTECAACHLADYRSAAAVNHVSANLPLACETCHGMDRWQGAAFDHQSFTRFPLTGAHARAACLSCHLAGRFQGTPAGCFGCHAPQFSAARDPDHVRAAFPHDCATCHTTAAWTGAAFDHAAHTGFALSGAHVQAACNQCHLAGRFAGTARDCRGCHLADFERAVNPDHRKAGFSASCDACHGTANWQNARFDHSLSAFPLTGAHAQVECARCHVGGRFTGASAACIGCHRPEFESTAGPSHVAAGFSQDCTACHTTVQWKGAQYDHSKTRFPLTGAHGGVSCSQCHAGNRFAGTSGECQNCHLEDFNRASNPNHAAAGFPRECAACHTTAQWTGARFDHSRTRFPLTGAHGGVSCSQCHAGDRFTGTAVECQSCHLEDFNRTSNPNHAAAGFPRECVTCHTTANWSAAAFDHNSRTRFPLSGAHAALACAQCHAGNRFTGTAQQCEACHLEAFNRTTEPNHAAAGFARDCASCHSTSQWKGARFDHNARTRFALTGAHAGVACSQCHAGGRFTGTSQECAGCHLDAFNRTANPNHASAGFPQDCAACHTTSQWKGARFDHNAATRFPLTGAHVNAACGQCHANGRFAGTTQQCAGCHLDAFNRTTSPNHPAAGFPQDCAACHTTSQWKGARFDHNAATRFPLTGAHVNTACGQCHVNNRFAGTPQQCAGCHLTDYNRTTNPNHASAGFPQDCAACHSTSQWKGAAFNHSKFPLTGAHQTTACSQCHVNGRFAGTPAACSSCHLDDYQRTSSPNHAAAGFPQDCAMCHGTTQWKGAVFNHSTTRFPLTGAHTSQSCGACHSNGVYRGTPSTCDGCHLKQYNATTNPNHAAAGFPKDCALCHNTSQWKGAQFSHNSMTKFPLTGAHTRVACSDCHVNNRYAGTPTDCYSCHAKEYQSVSNPNHIAAGFPKTCGSCHTTVTWSGASFTHSFPIYSGSHAGKWSSCNDCHTNPSNYSSFSCTNCHEHSKTEMDKKHKDVKGYAYNSSSCYSCHPQGKE